ncbi:hypothetical protein [Arthrobacter caoxuetaonis]|uniref:Uncharacterized protein n=1 Tax=Arthrobacter caoxuetaonis TaxID=2886935 RepID=A0A9X1SD21_9MICC|nr:hypothetical protein [Arthrobacter caoxuetaonis]MCC3299260.1 hypothetical protein [Arthrobacter caoxuetaonis]USQ59246.1 hypothetical protein NF551_16820 [Arthrobacter caoxuetaonis]
MTAGTSTPADIDAVVAGTGIALLKSLPSRSSIQDRSPAGWGDFIRFASSEATLFTPVTQLND